MATSTKSRKSSSGGIHAGWIIAAGAALLAGAAVRGSTRSGGGGIFDGWRVPFVAGGGPAGAPTLHADPQNAIERVNAYIDKHSASSVEDSFMGKPRITYFFDAEGNPDVKRQVAEIRLLFESAGAQLVDPFNGVPPEGTLLAFDVVHPGQAAGLEGIATIGADVGKGDWHLTIIEPGFFGF